MHYIYIYLYLLTYLVAYLQFTLQSGHVFASPNILHHIRSTEHRSQTVNFDPINQSMDRSKHVYTVLWVTSWSNQRRSVQGHKSIIDTMSFDIGHFYLQLSKLAWESPLRPPAPNPIKANIIFVPTAQLPYAITESGWTSYSQGLVWGYDLISTAFRLWYADAACISEICLYMGPNFLTQPDQTQYPTDPTQSDPRILGLIWPESSRSSKLRLLFCEDQHKYPA